MTYGNTKNQKVLKRNSGHIVVPWENKKMATRQSLSERKLMFLEVSERKIKTSAFFGLKCTLDSTLNCGTLQILRIMEHGLILCLRTMLTIQCCLKSIEISVENKLNKFHFLLKVPLHWYQGIYIPLGVRWCANVKRVSLRLAPSGAWIPMCIFGLTFKSKQSRVRIRKWLWFYSIVLLDIEFPIKMSDFFYFSK